MSLAAVRIVPGYEELYSHWLASPPADGVPTVPPTPPRSQYRAASAALR